MDARIEAKEWPESDGAKYLCRIFVRCIVPLLEGPAPQNAQALVNCLRILRPQTDVRKLQALVHYRLGQYVDAVRIFDDFEDAETRAMAALCQRALGEPSWLGVAERIMESGDAGALAILQPWFGNMPEEPAVSEPAATASGPYSLPIDLAAHHASRPMRV